MAVRRLLGAIAVVVALLAIASAAFVGTASAKDYKVGESAHSGDLIFTVYGFTDPHVSSNLRIFPVAGHHYVVVYVGVKNPSKRRQSYITTRSFQLVDKTGEQYDMTFSDLPEPDEDIPGKVAVRGYASFSIPDNAPGPMRFRAQRNGKGPATYWGLTPPPQ